MNGRTRLGGGGRPVTHDSPEAVGLAHGDRVRWMAGSRRTWRYGTVRYVERDGSVAIYDGHGLRSLQLDALAVERHGPRGGKVWLACDQLGQVAS